jgi:hypothetical protein
MSKDLVPPCLPIRFRAELVLIFLLVGAVLGGASGEVRLFVFTFTTLLVVE